jgi:hypothetical protein
MRIKFIFMVCLCCGLGFLSAQSGHAAIYKYLDKDGLICFANDLQSVPELYRASAKIVSGEVEQENRPPVQDQQASGQPAGDREPASGMVHEKSSVQQNDASFFSKRALLSTIVIVSAVFAFIILGILEADHKKAVLIARVALLWGVAVYLLIAHAEDAVRMVRTIGSAVDDAKHQSGEKGKKAGKAIKALNELAEQAGQATSGDPLEAEREKKE